MKYNKAICVKCGYSWTCRSTKPHCSKCDSRLITILEIPKFKSLKNKIFKDIRKIEKKELERIKFRKELIQWTKEEIERREKLEREEFRKELIQWTKEEKIDINKIIRKIKIFVELTRSGEKSVNKFIQEIEENKKELEDILD